MWFQVYMADMLSPVLGDGLYSYRARPVMGVMTRISHKNSPVVVKPVSVIDGNQFYQLQLNRLSAVSYF